MGGCMRPYARSADDRFDHCRSRSGCPGPCACWRWARSLASSPRGSGGFLRRPELRPSPAVCARPPPPPVSAGPGPAVAPRCVQTAAAGAPSAFVPMHCRGCDWQRADAHRMASPPLPRTWGPGVTGMGGSAGAVMTDHEVRCGARAWLRSGPKGKRLEGESPRRTDLRMVSAFWGSS